METYVVDNSLEASKQDASNELPTTYVFLH